MGVFKVLYKNPENIYQLSCTNGGWTSIKELNKIYHKIY